MYLIIGTGAAGWRAAIAATQAGAEVRMVGKRPQLDAHTVLAAGGINAALGRAIPGFLEQHFADTLLEGYRLGDPRMVEILAREPPRAVLELAEWGCDFARTPAGELTSASARIAGDARATRVTSRVAPSSARCGARRRVGHRVDEDQYVSRLLVADSECSAPSPSTCRSGERTAYLADAVVLATAATRGSGVEARRAGTRITATGCASRCDAGCR